MTTDQEAPGNEQQSFIPSLTYLSVEGKDEELE
jgi:hypothetical protein